MEDNNHLLRVFYVANVRMPNVRAHGVQIANTCEALGRLMNVTLVTPMFSGDHTPLSTHFGISETFRHRKIFALDIPGIPFRYALRNASFFLSANIYLILTLFMCLMKGEKAVVYVRGETILFLIPLTFLLPIFFETHQIRNYERWYRIALTRVRGIIVVTEALKRKFVEEYGVGAEKILVARDAVDVERFSRAEPDGGVRKALRAANGRKVILYSGTLSEEKGVHTLAAAARLLPEIQVAFLGGTDVQIRLFKERYEGVDNIAILGRVNHPEVPRYVSAADVLVLPDMATDTFSNLFTSPMKLFEYMASGKPIIASRVPSLCEVLDGSTAIFFEPGKAESLAEVVRKTLRDEEEAKRRATRAKDVVGAFTWRKRAEAIAGHMKNLLSCDLRQN